MRELKLYFRPFCPYCRKVTEFMNAAGIDIPMVNISENDNNVKELISIGGKPQVPCLVIDGKAMYESDDIIEWLNDSKG